ncbi:MAG: DNA methyltransferase, partial [Holosporales bacterium]
FLVNVNQFHGIEIDSFAVRIAETAMFMVGYLCDTECKQAGHGHFTPIFPIQSHPQIINANALQKDWKELLDPAKEACIIGNPPYLGSSLNSKDQHKDRSLVLRKTNAFSTAGEGATDFAALWLRLSFQLMLERFLAKEAPIRCGYVTTSSLFQGAQAHPVWQKAIDRGIRIDFIREPFKWTSEASNAAAVHCVSFGFSMNRKITPRIFKNNSISPVLPNPPVTGSRLSPYMIFTNHPEIIPSRPIKLSPALPESTKGSILGDFNNFVISETEYKTLIKDARLAPYIRNLVGTESLTSNKNRYCFYLKEASPDLIATHKELKQRTARIREERQKSN